MGAWIGRFHIKQVVRACFHIPFDGDAQIDKATYEVDFWNRIGVSVSPDRRSVNPIPSNGQSDNVSPLVKAISQFLGTIGQIVTVGFVPQADIQAIDAHSAEEKALQFMQQYEQGILRSTSSAGPKDYAGFTLDFLFTNATFTKLGGRPILSIDSSQNETNLPSKSEACTIRETLEEMKTGGKMVGPNGTHYVTSPGDSFWSIAKKFYGNGKYHLLVSGQNEIGTAQMNHLVVGKTLQLDSLARLQKRDDLALVMKGESLWKIAKRPSHKDFNILRANNAGWVADTNKIYPLQFIRTVPVQKPKKP